MCLLLCLSRLTTILLFHVSDHSWEDRHGLFLQLSVDMESRALFAWPRTSILPISASPIARITGVSQ
jgi:hypothetical protein